MHEQEIRSALEAAQQREREIARLSRLYAALVQINTAITGAATRMELLQRICRALVEHGGFRMSWIGWYDPATHRISPVASHGDDTGYLDTIVVYGDDRPEGYGPAGTAFREARASISNDLLNDTAAQPWHAALLPRTLRAAAVVPLREAGHVRGTLSVYADEVGCFRDAEVALLVEAAGTISFAFDNLARDEARRRAEATLREERDFSEAVLRSLPGVLYLFDEAGRFLRWNENFERVTGYTGVEIAGMRPGDFFTDAERPLVAARIAEVFATGEANIEADLRAKVGALTRYHFTGVQTIVDGRRCLIGAGVDISARERAEAARRASEARYRALFDYAPDGILIADPQSSYVDANPSACRMLGRSLAEMVGLHARDIVVEQELPEIPVALREILASADYHREWELRRKDGSVFPADVIATLLPDGNLLALIRDITARKQTERALREANEGLERKVSERTAELQAALVRAEAADRLKSAFLATMSHELRTPLNSILGFTGILVQHMAGPLNAEQDKQLGMVRTSARHLLELINDVLDLSKIEAGQLEVYPASFDLRAAIERVIATVSPQASAKHLVVTAAIAPEVREVVSDRRRVEQILLNLVNNAIKFTDQGSIHVTADRANDRVSIRVADTGIGIKPEDLAALFQPFRQLDTGLTRHHEGTGLGLAICRRLATLLDGEIAVRSTWGRGSALTLILPVPR